MLRLRYILRFGKHGNVLFIYKVLNANFFSAYNGKIAIKLPIGKQAASFGIMIIGDKVNDPDDIRHEYGHTQQFDDLGIFGYAIKVAIPSVVTNIIYQKKTIPDEINYYGSIWER